MQAGLCVSSTPLGYVLDELQRPHSGQTRLGTGNVYMEAEESGTVNRLKSEVHTK